jgi:peptide-methionine (S)-S-oxide reductase
MQTNDINQAHAGSELPLPKTDLAADQNPVAGDKHLAIFAAGCFWCVEGVFRQLRGVTEVVSGYAGAGPETANYEAVCTGATGHAEAVQIAYDPSTITYGELLRVFFATHDPTTRNRQGPDAGTQYRSAIFYLDEDQRTVAQGYIRQLDDAKAFARPVVTTLEPLKAGAFYPAEDYHQDYITCNMDNPYIRHHALPKVEKVRKRFKDKVK